MISRTKLFGDNQQIVLSGNRQIYIGDSGGKICFQVNHFFPDSFTGQGVLNLDPNVWLHRARPPSRYNSMYIKIKIDELYINRYSIWRQNYLAMEITIEFCMGNHTPT
jgi:hypothetical protein